MIDCQIFSNIPNSLSTVDAILKRFHFERAHGDNNK